MNAEPETNPAAAEPSQFDSVEAAMLMAWHRATAILPTPSTAIAFDAACWRILRWMNSFEDCGLKDILIVSHAPTWAKKRQGWDPPPCQLCSTFVEQRRFTFWLLGREVAREEGYLP